MRSLAQRARRVACAALCLTCMVSTALWAGGSGFGDDDDTGDEDAGPSYFGFVKDTNGGLIANAKVTVAIKNRGGIVTRTNVLGAYKVPGFSKDVDPKTVEISCAKDGYKQVRVLTRPRPNNDPTTPIESECILQKV
jgi:hypothetical protein